MTDKKVKRLAWSTKSTFSGKKLLVFSNGNVDTDKETYRKFHLQKNFLAS